MLAIEQDSTDREQAIVAFAVARGNFALAAERLHVPETRLRTLLAEDPELLARHLHTQTLINVFESLFNAHLNLRASLPDMEPYEKSKTYTALLQLAQTLSQPPAPPAAQQPNILIQNMMQQFPPDVREAVQYLIQEPE